MTSRDPNSEAKNKILRLALAGASVREVARRLGLPEAVVKCYYPAPPKPGFQKGNKTNSPWRNAKRDKAP